MSFPKTSTLIFVKTKFFELFSAEKENHRVLLICLIQSSEYTEILAFPLNLSSYILGTR